MRSTLYLLELTAFVMYGDLMVGDALRERLELGTGAKERRAFRRWFVDEVFDLATRHRERE